MGDRPPDALAQVIDVARLEVETGDAIRYDFPDCAIVDGEDRRALSERFDRDAPERLVHLGWRDQHLGPRHQLEDFVAALAPDIVEQGVLTSSSFCLLGHRAITDDRQADRRDLLPRLGECKEPLWFG